MPAVLLAAEETTHVVTELPFPAELFGLAGFGALITMLLVTFAFRSVGNRNGTGLDQHP